jgi:RNA polymerase sigma-70 factor (ECF subfamily)
MLSSYVLSLVHDPNLAEDILQDVAVNLLEKFETFDGDDFPAWARTVARWHVLNHWRSESRYHRALKESTLAAIEAEYRLSERRFLSWESRKEALVRCLRRIEAGARRLLEMRFVESLRIAEIAEAVGKTAGAVQMSIARTKDRLADCVRRRTAQAER